MSFVKYIPNILTLFRVFCVFPFMHFLLFGNKAAAFVTIIAGSISDFLDGYIARRCRVSSKLGELLDPLADKIFTNVVLWGMAMFHQVSFPYWCTYCVLAIALSFRDFILLLGAVFVVVRRKAINLKPVYVSKVCTAMVFTFISYSILFIDKTGAPYPTQLGLYFGYACVAMVGITFGIYAGRFVKSIMK